MLNCQIFSLSCSEHYNQFFESRFSSCFTPFQNPTELIARLIRSKYSAQRALLIFVDDSILNKNELFDFLKRLHELDNAVQFLAYLPRMSETNYSAYQEITANQFMFFSHEATEVELRQWVLKIITVYETNRQVAKKEKENQQLIQRQEVQSVLFNGLFSVVKFNEWGQIVDINDYGKQETGWHISKVLGRSVHDIFLWSNDVDADRADFHSFSGETRYFSASGQQRWALVQVKQMRENGADFFYVVSKDITEQKNFERLKRFDNFQEGVDKAKSELIHNFGNTVNSMTATQKVLANGVEQINNLHGYIQRWLSGKEEQNTEDAVEFIAALDKGMAEILGKHFFSTSDVLKNDLLVLSDTINNEQKDNHRGENMTPVNLYNLIQAVINSSQAMLNDRGVDIKMLDSNTTIFVKVSRNEMFQALLNLVKNAAEALNTSSKSLKLITIGAEASWREGVTVTVHDSGEGIDEVLRDKVFTSGFTTKSDGLGEGLHSVANFMNAYDGEVELVSSMQHGTSFILKFPSSRLSWA